MAEKKFGWRREFPSAVPDTSNKDLPDATSKAAPAADRPAPQPDTTPAEVAPKS